MDKFWKWMEKKGYARELYKDRIMIDAKKMLVYYTTQMLTGYKIEYICEKQTGAFLDLRIIALNTIVNLDNKLNDIIEAIK